jgi:glycerophosphoryl diester phosphodiesterase
MNSTLLLILTAALLAGCAAPQAPTDLPQDPLGLEGVQYILGAHRGDSIAYTENTTQAILSACKNPKYTFVEFDVQYSADGVPVVFHDYSLRRLFGHRNKISKSTWNELCELSGNGIATYDEIMDVAKGKPLNIEIKSQGDPEEDRQLADYIMSDIRRRGIADRVLISSVSAEAITYVKEHYPEMPTGQIFWITASTVLPFDFLTEALYDNILESRADYLMLHTANRMNLNDLFRLKPKDKTLVFWDFGDTMYVVHKDPADPLWTDIEHQASVQ